MTDYMLGQLVINYNIETITEIIILKLMFYDVTQDWLRERERPTDRQTETDRQRQTDRPTDRQTDRPTDRQTDRQTDRPTDRGRPTETDRQRPTDRDRPTETDRQRQTDRDRPQTTKCINTTQKKCSAFANGAALAVMDEVLTRTNLLASLCE